MKFSAQHQSTGLTATVKFPSGETITLVFPKNKKELPIFGDIGGVSFESSIQLLDRTPDGPADAVDQVIVMALPSKITTKNTVKAKTKHSGESVDLSEVPAEKRSKSGLSAPEIEVTSVEAEVKRIPGGIVSPLQLSPGKSDEDMRPTADQNFSRPVEVKRADPMQGVMGNNPFAPPAAFVDKTAGFKGLDFGGDGKGLTAPVEKTGAEDLTDEQVEDAITAKGLSDAPGGEADKPSEKPASKGAVKPPSKKR